MRSKSVSQLKKEADAVFSEYIRRKYADWKGMVRCITCPTFRAWQQMQAGHYESRMHNATRYDERNVHPQCSKCNVWHTGEKPAYALYLQRTYGPKILAELRLAAKKTKQFTVQELRDLIQIYKAKIEKL
jgi:hypothetical protein